MAIWRVKTHYKKSCQEREIWTHPTHGTMTRVNGYRFAEFEVETNDDEPPKFEFDYVPDGDGKKDSINMYDCPGENIENVELIEMFDGGCWVDVEWPEDIDEEVREELEALIDEEGWYALEESDDPWSLDETEVWVWGPIEICDEEGNTVRIICADDEGNVVDFKEE